MRYTVNPARLIMPTEKTIQWHVTREGLGELTELEWDFLWDLLAKTGGAQVAEFDEDTAKFDAGLHAATEVGLLQQKYGERVDIQSAHRRFENDHHTVQHQMHYLLERLDINDLPGRNHALKAVRLIKLIRQAKERWLLGMIVLNAVVSLLYLVQGALDQVDELSGEDKEVLRQFVGPNAGDEGAEMLGAELAAAGLNLAELTRISRQLDQLGELRGKEKPRLDPNGEDVGSRSIRDLGEIGRVPQVAHALPEKLRIARAAAGDFDVRTPTTRRSKKQLLFAVVDGSSSMLHDKATAASRAAGVIINRLKAVIDGDAELYLRFFDTDLRATEYHAHDAASARELMRIVSDPSHYQGGTRFDQPLTAAAQRVQDLMAQGKLCSPELVIVTDGYGTVPDPSVLQGVKLHAVQVGSDEEEELAEFARQSGGVALHAAFGSDVETEM